MKYKLRKILCYIGIHNWSGKFLPKRHHLCQYCGISKGQTYIFNFLNK